MTDPDDSKTTGSRHIFVILRHDEPPAGVHADWESDVVATTAYWSSEKAEAEAARLNQLRDGPDPTYRVVLARVRDG